MSEYFILVYGVLRILSLIRGYNPFRFFCNVNFLFQYTLSQETIEYLKQPTFDIWHWEPNEVNY